MSEFIRVWKKLDINEVSEHLLTVGSLTADCSKCRELGINYSTSKTCPSCGTDFKYIASRGKEIGKIKARRPDLIFVDFEDYKKITGKLKAKNFFKKE